jgi:hypothetical protein
MPRIVPIIPPNNEAAAKVELDKIVAAAKALDIPLEMQGFVANWLSDNTRVFLATEGDTPVGFGVLVFGRRYYDNDMSASVLIAEGLARKEMLEFMADSSKMLGATMMFYEAREGDTLGGSPRNMLALEL